MNTARAAREPPELHEHDGRRVPAARGAAPAAPSPGLDVLALQRSAGNAAVARMLATRPAGPTLQRRTEMPAADPVPRRVVSKSGAIVLVGLQELYATPAKIAEGAGQLQGRGSFVTLVPGETCAFDGSLRRVQPQPAPVPGGQRPPRLQQLHSGINAPDEPTRREKRAEAGSEQFNAERNQYGSIALAEATTLFEAEVSGTLNSYATFSDCHRNTELVMGAEDEVALYGDFDTARGELPSMTKDEAGGFGRKSFDPATRGAYAWLARAIPEFPTQLAKVLEESKIEPSSSLVWQRCQGIIAAIRGSVVSRMSINDPATRADALGAPDYPKELWRLYRMIQDNDAAADTLAMIYGVNKGLSVRVGDGIAVINDTYEKQAADVKVDAARRDVDLAKSSLAEAQEAALSEDADLKAAGEEAGAAASQLLGAAQSAEDAATKWNFHWLPVILTDDEDFVVLENAAGDDADVNRFDTYRWRFKMFGPEQTLHEESGLDTHTTEHYLTLPYTRAPERPRPLQGAGDAVISQGLTEEEREELRANPSPIKQGQMARLIKARNNVPFPAAQRYIAQLLAA